MPATSLSVKLLTMTPDAEALVYSAAHQCYSNYNAITLFESAVESRNPHDYDAIDVEGQNKLIRKVIDSGHTSILEVVSLSFAISGISRACSHQLVRHRVGCSYAQQSQRYVKADDFEYVVPQSCKGSTLAHIYNVAMDNAREFYEGLIAAGVPAEDARFVLPNACATKLVVTMNCRALLHFFEERTCARAQWEIRALANAMLATCKERLPVVFENAGPKCVRQGYCNEHKSCGRFPKRGE